MKFKTPEISDVSADYSDQSSAFCFRTASARLNYVLSDLFHK